MRSRNLVHPVAALLIAVALIITSCSSDDSSSSIDGRGAATTRPANARGADVAVPDVSGPVTGGQYDLPFNAMPERLAAEFGYIEEEFFISGTATSYSPSGVWRSDGHWAVMPSTTAPYRTRVIVQRPIDAAEFNGTVVVEWLNVTAGLDADPDFGFAHDALLADGFVHVGVSAQLIGVEGGSLRLPIEGFDVQALKSWDPERYGSLVHPGDDYSYDIFSQAAQALRAPAGLDPLGDLDPTYLIAAGESQSAGRLTTYANAVQPVADSYDGLFIHSRGGTGAVLSSGQSDPMPPGAHIRDDLDVPVMQIATETDLFGLGFARAHQPDTDRLRTWEIAGTAHADQSTTDYGVESHRQWNTTTQLDFTDMCGALNNGPQGAVVRRAFVALAAWIEDGTEPAMAPLIEVLDDSIVRDDHGNARGGVRTPAVDVPISTLSGEQDEGESVICSLFGSTTPFSAAQLQQLYPTHEEYVADVETSARAVFDAGFLLPADRDEMVVAADSAPVPS